MQRRFALSTAMRAARSKQSRLRNSLPHLYTISLLALVVKRFASS